MESLRSFFRMHCDHGPCARSAAIPGCGFGGHPCPQFELAAGMPPEPAGKDADATRFKEGLRLTILSFRILLPFVLFALLAGCASRKPPPPLPASVAVAQRTAAQASRFSQSQNWKSAARDWRLAADRYAALNDRANEAVALHNLAQAQKGLGALAAAHQVFEQAARLNEELGRTNEWWRNQIALLQVEALLKQTRSLDARFQQLAPSTVRIADPSVRGIFLNEQGLWRQSEGNLEMAGEAFRQAEQAFLVAKDESGVATVLANRAGLEHQRKNYPEAIDAWRAALAKFERLGDARGIARALAGEGGALLSARRDLKVAEDLLRRAARNYRTMKLPGELEPALESLAECLMALDKPAEAEAVKAELTALKGP